MAFSNLSDLLNKLPKYVTYTVVVVIIGFIYVQGMFNWISNDTNIPTFFIIYNVLNLFDLLDMGTVPISKESYIINGLLFLYSVFIQFLISLILFRFICWADKYIQTYLSQKSLSKTYIRLKKFLSNMLWCVLFLIIIYAIQFTIAAYIDKIPNIDKNTHIITFIRAVVYILNILYIFILICYYKSNRNKSVAKNYITIFLAVLLTMLFVYFNGFVHEKLKIGWTLSKGYGMNFVKVFLKEGCVNTPESHDENPMELLKIELNDKYIIGYHYRNSEHNNTIEIIPIDKIDRVEKWNPS